MEGKKILLRMTEEGEENPPLLNGILFREGKARRVVFSENGRERELLFDNGRAEISLTGPEAYRLTVEEGKEHPFFLKIPEGTLEGTVLGREVRLEEGIARGRLTLRYGLFSGTESLLEKNLLVEFRYL